MRWVGSDKHESMRIWKERVERKTIGIAREATLSVQRKSWPKAALKKREIHLRGARARIQCGKRVSGGPLAPLETEIGLDGREKQCEKMSQYRGGTS